MSILIVSNIWNSPTRTTEEVWLLSNLDNYRKYQKCFFGNVLISEAVAWRCSVKKILLEILKATVPESFLTKLPATLSKKRLWHKCFPVNFAKFLQNTAPVAASVISFKLYSILLILYKTIQDFMTFFIHLYFLIVSKILHIQALNSDKLRINNEKYAEKSILVLSQKNRH